MLMHSILLEAYGLAATDSNVLPLLTSVASNTFKQHTLVGQVLKQGRLLPGLYLTAAGQNVSIVNASVIVSPAGLVVAEPVDFNKPFPFSSPTHLDAGKARHPRAVCKSHVAVLSCLSVRDVLDTHSRCRAVCGFRSRRHYQHRCERTGVVMMAALFTLPLSTSDSLVIKANFARR
jgi:hypothetical protein